MRYQRSVTPVPAVVVGGNLNGLGVVRSLSRGRIPVVVLDTTRQCPAAWSRYGVFRRASHLEGEMLIDALVRVASDLACRPVLILTSEESVLTVSAFRQRIEPLYRIDLPPAAMVAALADKTLFHTLAEERGFAVPRSRTVKAASDLDSIGELTPPLILKPADKTLVLAGLAERVVVAATGSQARAAAAQMLTCAPALIVQEWVAGPDTEIFFSLFTCDREARLIGFFPGRKLVCSPPAVGSTALCVAAPEVAEELQRDTLRFVRSVGYRGLGSLEFKRDGNTGRLLIIEPTVGRTDWQEEIATLCGVNLPLQTYWTAMGAAPPPLGSPDSASIAWRSSREFLMPHDLIASGARVFDGHFRWRDPLPAAYYYGYERLALRLWRRAARLVRPTSLFARAH